MRLSFIIVLTVSLIIGCKNLEKGSTSSEVKVSYGKVDRIPNFQSAFVKPRNVDVLLPATYDMNKSYPVLYMHDGQMLFDSTNTWNKQEWGVDETISKLISSNSIPETIVVGIWNGDDRRHAEYYPQKAFEMLPTLLQDSLIKNAKRYGEKTLFTTEIQSDRYLKFLVQELKPYIDKTYKTMPEKENTSIAGSSMGGLISMYALCEFPQIFGNAACISTHWLGTMTTENNPIPTTFVEYLKAHLPPPKSHKIYFDYGTETLDAHYEPYQKAIDTLMMNKSYTSEFWITKKFEGADHSEKAWKERLHIPFTFILN